MINEKFEEAKSQFLKGLDFFQRGMYQEAESSFRKSLSIIPDRESTLTNLSATLIKLKKYSESEKISRYVLNLNNANHDSWSNLGNALKELKQYDQALASYNKAIGFKSDYVEAWYNRGLLLVELRKYDQALASFDKAISIKSNYVEAWYNRGLLLMELRQYDQALSSYDKVIRLKPDFAEGWCNRGIALKELKQYDQALASYDKATSLKPYFAEAWSNRGGALLELKRFNQALASYDKAISLTPDFADAWYNRGVVLLELSQYDQAMDSYDKAISLQSDYVDAWYNRGAVLIELNQYDQAIASYEKAISLKPDFVEAWSSRGVALMQLKQYDQSLTSYDKAISLTPDFAEAWSNRGIALSKLKQYEQALASYDKAVSLKSDYAEAWYNRGNLLTAIGRFSLAEESYREAIRLDSELLKAHSNLLLSLNYVEKCSSQVKLAEAKKFGLKVSKKAQPKFTSWEVPASTKKLRIGFVSGDFRNHSVGHFVEGFLEQLDKSQYEIYAFPTTSEVDELTYRIKPYFTKWLPIYGMSDQAAATLIHQKGTHVLIDLSVHTAHNRLAVFSYKPAPVQVSWLGLPMTTGVPEMDYVIGDPHALPKHFENQFTEVIWRLPEIYLCLTAPGLQVEVGSLPATRNKYVTFGSFNNLSKMNDKVVETWSNILKALPNSRLLLKSKQLSDSNICLEVQSRFKLHGVSADRLILKNALNARADHLDAYNSIDIALDTFFYPGVTTSAEALWMGVPVLSLKGNNFLSCTAKSIAENVELKDWVASDVNDYVNKALQFASDIDGLTHLRSTLRERVLRSPLFDTPRFANNFGEALWGMWNQCSQIKSD